MPYGTNDALQFLKSGKFTAQPFVNFTGLIPLYSRNILKLFNLYSSVNYDTLRIQFSSNNGVTYDTGANYNYVGYQVQPGTGVEPVGQSLDNSAYIIYQALNNDSAISTSGIVIELFQPTVTGQYMNFTGGGFGLNSGLSFVSQRIDGQYVGAPSLGVNAFRIFGQAGNLTGNYVLLGEI